MFDLGKEISLVEAILFLDTEPLDEQTIVKISGLSVEIVEKAIEELKLRYSSESSGLDLVKVSGGWILTPKKDLWNVLKDRYGKKNEGKLSKAAIETLSIIAYSQPITRSEIEVIRGVSVDNMIRLLMEKDLIKEVGKKDILGKPVQYGTTKSFLKVFGLNSIAELPKLDEMESERFELAR